MKAIITTQYGPPEVMIIRDVEKPVVKDHEVLIKIKAIAVTSGDCRIRAFRIPKWYFWVPMRVALGLFKPRKPIQGLWLAGEIKTTGSAVTKFKTGQHVYGRTTGLEFGANAEYICLPENAVMDLKPANLTPEESVALPFGGLTALHFLRKKNVKKGDKILIYGASGAVGSSAVQLANYFGAEITAVCSTQNIEWVKNLGAHKTIDYTKEDFTAGTERFDVVFDAVGYINHAKSKKILKPHGQFISVITSGSADDTVESLHYLTELAEKGIIKPLIDKIYPFDQMVKAHRYVDQGHKKGNVVVQVY